MNMKTFAVIISLFIVAQVCMALENPDHLTRHRLIILADMGNEPDEMQQMVHMIACSNEFEIEGLIAVTSKGLHPNSKHGEYNRILHPELYIDIIEAYAKVYDNLQKHARGWHEPEALKRVVASGQKGYGIDDVGNGKSSQGSELIINALTKDDDRPVWIVINAGSNTLAQALFDYREIHTEKELDAFVAKMRVFENGAQDNAGAWICNQFPEIHWIRSNLQTYAYGGPGWKDKILGVGPNYWEPFETSEKGQLDWQKEHIINNHGALGELYPPRIADYIWGEGVIGFMEGGGTCPWLGLVNKGLSDIDQPSWGGWAGRFTPDKLTNYWSVHEIINKDEQNFVPFFSYGEVSDFWIDPRTGKEYNNIYTPVWRWREAMYNDFVCRMDWCVKPYSEANHHPVAAFNGDLSDSIIRMNADIGEVIPVDASASTDPDGDDLVFSWWVYKEAGTYAGNISIDSAQNQKAQIRIPTGASGRQIHVILELKDNNPIAPLFDYRRIVIDVN